MATHEPFKKVRIHDSLIATLQDDVVTLTTNSISSPANSTQGDILYHSGTGYVRLAAGTSGYGLKTQGAGANPIWGTIGIGEPAGSTRGDILYYTGTGYSRLAPGTSGYFLETQGSSADPIWAAVAAGVASPAGSTQGDILYHPGTTWARLGAGTSGYFLRTQGPGANPLWAAVPASQAIVSATRALGTVYQNTGNKFLIVTVTCTFDGGGGEAAAFVEAGDATPDTQVACINGDGITVAMTFVVASGSYYKVTDLGGANLSYWTEWTIG